MQNEELRTSQVELEAARMRYFDLYEMAPVGYCTISEKGLILEANLTAATLFGEARSLLVKRPLSQFILYEDQGIYHLNRDRLFETREPQSFELRMLKKAGTAFWANLAATVAEPDAGIPVCRIVIIDITGRKKFEEALIHSRNLMSYIIGHSRSAIAVHDRDLKYLYVSKRYIDDYNVKEDDVIGKHHYDVFPDLPQKWRDVHQMALAGEISSAKYDPYVRKDGTVDWTNWECRPWYDVDGSIGGIIIYMEVVTESKKAEEEKAKLESQLRQSQKMEAVGQLAGGISHDFNNLLSVISGYSQILLMNSDLSDNIHLPLEEINRAAELAANLTRQLLLFSRREPLESKIIDLDTVISGVEKMLRRLIKADIIVTRNINPDLWRIKADPGSIEQVIMNLVINASDAMPDGGILTVETENVKIDETNRLGNHSDIDSGAYVMLSVSDTGCGMDEKIKEHIFEPFFTTKEVGKGTGLGLATVYGIVKQSNAHIDVQSELGKGTRFRIYFPQVVNEEVADGEQQGMASVPRGNETILLTEDEESMRMMLQNFLQSIGYAVLPACNGKEALELVEKHKEQIRLLLTDITMPGMNGFELEKQIRDSAPEIKLLFMSGYDNPTITDKMMKISDNLIQKPINLPALAVKLRKILDGKGEVLKFNNAWL
jgi:PAS domain S-box-containing protein